MSNYTIYIPTYLSWVGDIKMVSIDEFLTESEINEQLKREYERLKLNFLVAKKKFTNYEKTLKESGVI